MATTQDLFDQYLEPSITTQPGERVLTVGGRQQNYDSGIKAAEGGDYGAIGPPTKSGGRAYGAHQVMDYNIPVWTKEVLGTALTPQEFLNSKEAQDKVFQTKFGQLVQKYGNAQDAASAWFTGRPYAEAKAAGANDGYHDVDWYVNKFNSGLGQSSGGGVTQASYQPSQQPEFGSAKTTGDLFDRLGTIIQGTASAPDVKPYEMKPAVPASVTALPPTPGAAVASAPVGYSGANNLLNAMGAGLNPYSVGLGRAASGAFADWQAGKGIVPALSNAPAYYAAGRDTYNAEREAWSKDNPGTATVTNLAGGIVPAIAGVKGAQAAGTALGNVLASRAPALAPGLAETGQLLSGQAGNFGSVPAAATRVGSLAASGAGQGAIAGATQTGITGGTVGENAQQGALFGGALGVPLGLAGNILMAPTRAAVTSGMRALQNELSLSGEQLPGSVLTADKGVNMLSRAGKSPITPEVQKKVSAALESQYKRLEAVAGTPLDTAFRGEMQQLRGEISGMNSLTSGQKAELYDVIKRANSPNGNMSGRDVVGFTRASGKLNEMQSDPDLKQFAARIQDAIWGNLERNNPTANSTLRGLRQQVAAWGQAASRAGAHSEYSQLAHAAGTGAFTGELASGLLLGEYNPLAVAQGMFHGNPITLGSAAAAAATAYGARKAAGAYANSPAFGRLLMGGGLGPQPNLGIPPAVQLYNEEQARRRAR